ncbi:alanine dehydrogenase [Clostridium tetanomorphum]|uniref:Alanine dehydrogenase n=1 Tax=Clostridium tetanomorphum TaxID=1553 RepID=A0A923E5V4_CLOTT|nr:alanine dehydrogenase [Clostridium tetanomorphum]KAJ53133.1 alanine dehydrogenase [Clostridium tetanomorphum DSM 665]MBC2396928.1 alanine dehydrogenase [Clostridium tetanomorphum]MBP1863105.1 alanine dehydrogenase [Clostridium tetanomorphum]NRS84214.1 alanine dehydrogenase [Clostridium tetanomorphum]NRZ97427.1 alanine dehydrogenase [Clostridium tetanomorphum]
MITLGFPRMHKEKNEKRDFLPDFFRRLSGENAEFFLEEGYGEAMGISKEEYLQANNNIKFVSNRECYEKDIVTVLRSPEFNEIDYMKDESALISMLHYPTRATRVKKLKDKNIFGVSMDSLRNDFLERIVVNYNGTSGNGIELAFKELSNNMKNFYEKNRETIKVTIIGMGMVGLYAAKAAGKYGNLDLNKKMKEIGAKGILVSMLPRSITSDREELIKALKETDILVDASTRDNASDYIITNDLISYLKPHAVILDLTADPYLTDINPIQVKAIEGIPTGTLDKPVIYPDDPIYNVIPEGVNKENRRVVVSCNAWPGIKPKECMYLYGMQLFPIVQQIIRLDSKDFSDLSDDYFNRAIYRGTIEYFEKNEKIVENK